MYNESLLKFEVDVTDYRGLMCELDNQAWANAIKEKVFTALPTYRVGRCPICSTPYVDIVDTYSLKMWVPGFAQWGGLFHADAVSEVCEHFAVVSKFWNFEGHLPDYSSDELTFGHNFPSEVPHVLNVLDDRQDSLQAVMHALPICKIENDSFVPKYTLYTISYFSKEPFERSMAQGARNQYFRKPLKYQSANLANESRSEKSIFERDDLWDLTHFVNKGQLLWLELDNPDAKLMRCGEGIFPYGNINGRRRPYWQRVPSK